MARLSTNYTSDPGKGGQTYGIFQQCSRRTADSRGSARCRSCKINLTKRQLLCFGAGALIGVPSFFLLKAGGNTSMASICMIIIMLPFFFLGMYERDGQPLEKIAKQFIQAKFVRPKVRPYQTNNYYAVLIRQAQAEMEVNHIVYGEKSVPKNRKKKPEHAEESD